MTNRDFAHIVSRGSYERAFAAICPANLARAAIQLERELARVYPDIFIRVTIETWEPNAAQSDPSILHQGVEYRAPLAVLRRYGLVNDRMMSDKARGRAALDGLANGSATGDGYTLAPGVLYDRGVKEAPNTYTLFVYTESCPRERSRISVKDAAKVLRPYLAGGH